MRAVDPRHGRYLSAAAMYRGDVSAQAVDKFLLEQQSKFSSHFVEWIPNNMKSSLCDVAPDGYDLTGYFLLRNNTAIQEVFKRIHSQLQSVIVTRRTYVPLLTRTYYVTKTK
eukprot:TRINITY_DN12834_c0_g1_i1.p1 TRINITY_DN12834_c0_g1~~TRINITY_DN12834_c0_g1_i1.p1  ORF type:complete len:130 (+),score=21.44 TRINITY_DN12834_c0_g1_i1:57-392(+)